MKQLAAALALCLLLTGCIAPAPAGESKMEGAGTSALFVPKMEAPARQTLMLLVNNLADHVILDGAELFAEKVHQYTNELLTVQVLLTEDPERDYRDGVGDLLFYDGRAGGLSEDLRLLSSPLLYSDATAMSMALNSVQLLEAINGELVPSVGTYALGAFYTGSDFLMMPRRRLAEAVEEEEDVQDDEIPAMTASVRQESVLGPILESMGANIAVEDELAARYQSVANSRVDVAEIDRDEVGVLGWRDSGVTLLNMQHNLSPLWLLMRWERYEAFPANYQAAIKEGTTFVYPVIDDWYSAQVQDTVSRVREQGGSVDSIHSSLRQLASRGRSRDLEADYRARYLLELVESLQ